MLQPIIGFRQDDAGDWVAQLACGHGQHLRHKPPFINRPWVLSARSRQEHLGQTLECLKCDRGEPVAEKPPQED